MIKALETLSRVKKNAIDELRRTLGNFFEVERQLSDAIVFLENEYLKEKELAKNIELYDFGTYTKFYLQKKEELTTALLEIKKQINILQDKITDEFKEQKTFDIIAENKIKEMLFEQETKTQKMLDEIATNSYIRKEQTNV